MNYMKYLSAGLGVALVLVLITATAASAQDQPPERTTPPTPAVATPPRVVLEALGAFVPPPYRATTLDSTPDLATRTFRDAMRDYERGDYAASAKGLTAAARLTPSSPQTHFYLGASYLFSGDSAAAVRALQTTIDLGESAYLEAATFYLSKALIRRGNLGGARAELLKVVLLKGEHERDAQSLLAALDALRQPDLVPKGGLTGIDARVARVAGTRAYINIGAAHGVKIGDRFSIIHREQPIDPVTGMKLGVEEKQTGTGVVVEVHERFAIVNISGTAAVADVIKKN